MYKALGLIPNTITKTNKQTNKNPNLMMRKKVTFGAQAEPYKLIILVPGKEPRGSAGILQV
jgi:hypothetical protein